MVLLLTCFGGTFMKKYFDYLDDLRKSGRCSATKFLRNSDSENEKK